MKTIFNRRPNNDGKIGIEVIGLKVTNSKIKKAAPSKDDWEGF